MRSIKFLNWKKKHCMGHKKSSFVYKTVRGHIEVQCLCCGDKYII